MDLKALGGSLLNELGHLDPQALRVKNLVTSIKDSLLGYLIELIITQEVISKCSVHTTTMREMLTS